MAVDDPSLDRESGGKVISEVVELGGLREGDPFKDGKVKYVEKDRGVVEVEFIKSWRKRALEATAVLFIPEVLLACTIVDDISMGGMEGLVHAGIKAGVILIGTAIGAARRPREYTRRFTDEGRQLDDSEFVPIRPGETTIEINPLEHVLELNRGQSND